MISTLRGTLSSVSGHFVVIDVHGVGMKASVPLRTSSALRAGEETTLHTTLVVREDDLSLYGFMESAERDTFELLCGVNGVGPKSALGVLSEMTVDQVAQAVMADDDAAFRAVSGIGPKTAKLITLSLNGKIATPTLPNSKNVPVDTKVPPADQAAIVSALIGLGWSERVAKRGVSDMVDSLGDEDEVSVAALVKRALLLLGPRTVREEHS